MQLGISIQLSPENRGYRLGLGVGEEGFSVSSWLVTASECQNIANINTSKALSLK